MIAPLSRMCLTLRRNVTNSESEMAYDSTQIAMFAITQARTETVNSSSEAAYKSLPIDWY